VKIFKKLGQGKLKKKINQESNRGKGKAEISYISAKKLHKIYENRGPYSLRFACNLSPYGRSSYGILVKRPFTS